MYIYMFKYIYGCPYIYEYDMQNKEKFVVKCIVFEKKTSIFSLIDGRENGNSRCMGE